MIFSYVFSIKTQMTRFTLLDENVVAPTPLIALP
jgi:hypothetical protein